MRHKGKWSVLDRKAAARKALIKSLILALIKYGKITTTLAKAKAVKARFEKLITLGKNDRLHNFRLISNSFGSAAAKKIIKEISPRYKDRPGGYTRLVKIKKREGDGAEVGELKLI